jgi:hypothetical protein
MEVPEKKGIAMFRPEPLQDPSSLARRVRELPAGRVALDNPRRGLPTNVLEGVTERYSLDRAGSIKPCNDSCSREGAPGAEMEERAGPPLSLYGRIRFNPEEAGK